jgi:PAS domain S-box-containing protein
MGKPNSDYLLRAFDQLALPVVVVHLEDPGRLVVAGASASGRAYFGFQPGAGRPLTEALPGLAPATLAALHEVCRHARPANLYIAPGDATGFGRPFRAEPTLGADDRVDGLLLTATAVSSPAPSLPAGLPLISYTLSADGRRREYLSPQWFAYTGQDAATLDLTAAWDAALHPADLPGLTLSFGVALEAGQSWSGELRLRRHDGEYRWHLSQLVPERDAAGQVLGWQGFSFEVHEQYLTTERLRRREGQVRFLVETIPQLVWTADAHGGMSWVSEQWTRYTGLSLAQSAGGGWTSALHPDDLRTSYAYWAATVAAGTDADVHFRLREGSSGRYRWFMMRAHAQHDPQGRSTGWFGTATDVHELRETRQQLELKDQLLSQILGQVPALVATMAGPEHHFTYFNAPYAELTSQRPRLGRPVAECLPELAAQGVVGLLDEVYRTGRTHISHEAPFDLRTEAGERRHYLDVTYQPLRSGDGHVSGLLTFAVDVTTQVLARQQTEVLQAALRQQDARLRAMTETLPQTTFIAGPQGALEYISPQWFAYTGQAPDLDVNEVWTSYIHPDDLPRVQEQLARNQAQEIPWRYEFRLRRRDGQYRWHLSRGVPETDETGRVRRWFGSDTDIHELRELQEELRRGQARYRALTDKIPRQVWTANRNGMLDFFNERAAAYFGRDMSQLDPSDWLEVVHPDDRARAVARWRDSVAHLRSYTTEFRLLRHDGQYRWHLSEAAPETDKTGRVRRWYGTNTDVQEQRELAHTLRRSEEQFRFLAESVPQIVWTSTGVDGNDYLNQRWYDYTGLPPAAPGSGAHWLVVLHPDDVKPTTERWARCVATGEFFEIEYRFRRHDGQYRWFLGQARPQRGPDGRIQKWFGTCTDIEDQKQSQQLLLAQNAQLRRTNQDLDQFVYTASHDLRQPINNMAGIFEELTRTAYFRDPDAVLLIAMFEKALQQIDATIEELTAIVQVQRRQQPVPTAMVALAPLTEEVIGSLQNQITLLGAQVEFDFQACPELRFVRAQLQSVLLNLISNALRYAVPGRPPRVRLRSAPDPADQHPTLTVQDNGLGIDLARHGGQLFQLFSRFHTHVEGSGMGLYLVNRVVESHGGRVEVTSQVGEGTTFIIHLPA